ncbi:16S rRNA (guanine(527)-N(7))-methyltransferase RsmG [Kingella negevensis]|uniref:Ribosomal RNA small subunit methyltransferase G n=1 Tax=Kingella negevensis TaxID=1522312 RepID=A0A238TB19_9NEIS|nr:16S rRNA (guanine(527)-N(7))-methyltransferase RsmG [Kingella negevensis]MDK4684601.1 16S rRNA (guanine(527)-N(7))-methyltransferase RsmG [Kingella negevensis]MDK4696254.1 16S rRNA (guanine(527)-N(7))-methyltransferase RsmG [Kingella negevensis]MDK4707731.1 16S rRNA (guanine(527)-N(7))-methyltransferase RsmG [Kingella negevensis]MDK4709833.1 16S rRNA (guanine(527)-N(7))-methyltransferase RsmG [Kingella negevensis]SNB60853.1 Ribosomal RNA small subunit methyltransferase G [Kingella negevensi
MNHFASELANGIAAMNLSIDDAQQQKLLHYLELLKKWNKTYNLTALRDDSKMVSYHILDSLTLLPYAEHARTMIDVGSGGGMPGIPTAICRPDLQITLIDSNSKKTTFLQQAAIELGLKNLSVSSSRVENILDKRADIVTSRAFAELCNFVQLTRHLLNENGHWVAMKGVYPNEELFRLPENVEAYQIDSLTVPTLDAERHMVLLRPKHEETK